MIVTVTCNPAIDVTYRLPRLVPGQVHRVAAVEERPGGKGVNVARVLHQLGESVVATGLADGDFGHRLEQLGIAASFVPALPTVRRTVVVHADDATTGLWEPGAAPGDAAAASAALVERVRGLLVGARGLAVCGSLPAGVAETLPAELAGTAAASGMPVVLDLDDAPLKAAAAAGQAILVPNREELGRLVGHAPRDLATTARELTAHTRAPVMVTLGADGVLVADGDECWRAVPPTDVRGNPTGAGDSAVAALLRGLARGDSWPDVLRDVVAVSAAAVAAPVAGEIDVDRYRRWRPSIHVEAIDTLTTESTPRR